MRFGSVRLMLAGCARAWVPCGRRGGRGECAGERCRRRALVVVLCAGGGAGGGRRQRVWGKEERDGSEDG